MTTPACPRNTRGANELQRITKPHEGTQLVPHGTAAAATENAHTAFPARNRPKVAKEIATPPAPSGEVLGPSAVTPVPPRIIWLTDGPHVATEPVESTNCVIDDKGRVEHRDSCMTSRATRRATPDEVREWRVRE